MKKINILFAGCGFLTSHLFFHLIPHSDHIIFLDREKIEKENYDNSIFLKNYSGRRKVTALSAMTQILSSKKTTPIHLNVKKTTQIAEICEKYNVNFIFVTFDNIESRLLLRDFAIQSNIPTLFIGVTEGYIYIDWAEKIVLPESSQEIERINLELKQIRDVCTRLEFRPLGAIAAGYAYYAFIKWLNNNDRYMYNILVNDSINSTYLIRK